MATINQLISALNLFSPELFNFIKYQLNEKLVREEEFYEGDDEDYPDEDYSDCYEEERYEHTFVSFFCWEETHKNLEELFALLDESLKSVILNNLDLPDYLPHPWFGGKGLIKLLRKSDCYEGRTYLYLFQEIGWTIDNLRKLKNPVVLKVNKSRSRSRRLIAIQKFFLTEHHINVQLKLLEKVTKDFEFNGEIYTKSSEEIFYELLETWFWIFENSPSSLKGIRVRDIFSYYEELKKLKINLEPSYELPIDEVLKAKIGDNFEGYSVVFPTESKHLKRWGKKLDHCVGGYGEAVLKGACSIISLNKGENPVYTVEVRKTSDGYSVPQFMGYDNALAPEELVSKFKQLIN